MKQWGTYELEVGDVQECAAVEPWSVSVWLDAEAGESPGRPWAWSVSWPDDYHIASGRCETEAAAKQTALLELMKFLSRWVIRVLEVQDAAVHGAHPAGDNPRISSLPVTLPGPAFSPIIKDDDDAA